MSFGAAGWGQFLAVQALVKRLTATGILTITAAGLALISAATASAQLTALGVSTFIKTLLDDADAATARTTLGVSAAKVTNAEVTLSGTSTDITGIPAGVTRITLNIAGMSFTAAGIPLLQLGDSGGIETAGYLSDAVLLSNAAAVGCANNTAGFSWGNGAAAQTYQGTIGLSLVNAATFKWACSGNIAFSNGAAHTFTAGTKATSAMLDRVRFTSTAGADTFDAGTVNISWEF